MRRLMPNLLSSLFLACLLLSWAAHSPASNARHAAASEQRSQMTASQAAAKARAQYGGKVLKVSKQGKGYKVRLLKDSGRVITVTIRG